MCLADYFSNLLSQSHQETKFEQRFVTGRKKLWEFCENICEMQVGGILYSYYM